jgi:hypothetical protein
MPRLLMKCLVLHEEVLSNEVNYSDFEAI